MTVIRIVVLLAIFVYALFIGLMMLISPSRWFDLPRHLGLQGGVRRESLETSSGRRSVRLKGLVLTLGMIVMGGRSLSGLNGLEGPFTSSWLFDRVVRLVVFTLILTAGVSGVMLLIGSRKVINKDLEHTPIGSTSPTTASYLVRLAGLLFLMLSILSLINVFKKS